MSKNKIKEIEELKQEIKFIDFGDDNSGNIIVAPSTNTIFKKLNELIQAHNELAKKLEK